MLGTIEGRELKDGAVLGSALGDMLMLGTDEGNALCDGLPLGTRLGMLLVEGIALGKALGEEDGRWLGMAEEKLG